MSGGPEGAIPPPEKPPTALQVVDDWLAAPPTRPPGLRAAFDRLIQGPRSAWIVWTFGIVLPPVLLWAERPLAAEHDILPFRPFSSLLAFVSVGILLLWRIRRDRASGWTSALFAGAFGVATCGAAAVGAMVLAKALVDFVFGKPLALLGLVPLLTAWVFLGATLESLRRAIERAPLHRVVFFALVGGCVLVGGTWGGGHGALRIERSCVRAIARGGEHPKHMLFLRVLWWFPGVELLALEGSERHGSRIRWVGFENPQHAKPLSDAYREITGMEPTYRG